MSESPTPDAPTDAAESGQSGGQEGTEQEQTFKQADVDRIVRERVKREREKFADYDDLKAKAGEKATAEERIVELEKKHAAAQARALRSDIAAKYGIAAEDRDLFLTGTDEETLTAQAERLSARESERKKNGNHVPTEGNTPLSGEDGAERKFARNLFSSAEG